MPKLKNKSGAKKRFRLTGTGKVKFKAAGKRHMMRRRSQKMIRSTRAMAIMSDPDAKVVKRNFLIYAK
jgi:large subunit ribosomal protein L35